MKDQPPTASDWRNEPPNCCSYPGCDFRVVFGCDCCKASYCKQHRYLVSPEKVAGFWRCWQCREQYERDGDG